MPIAATTTTTAIAITKTWKRVIKGRSPLATLWQHHCYEWKTAPSITAENGSGSGIGHNCRSWVYK